MNRVQRWQPAMLTAMATVLLTAGLGWLSAVHRTDGNKPQEAAAVTASPQTVSVTEARLVDYLSHIPLQLRLSRAAWNGDGLTIDMKVASTITRPDAIYHDIYELLQHSFTRTGNVNRMLLRIVIQDERLKKNYVLLSLDAHKQEATPERLKAIRERIVTPDTEQALRFIYTPLWDRTFPGDR